jgi:hypothetical protein
MPHARAPFGTDHQIQRVAEDAIDAIKDIGSIIGEGK